jgi:hypothetical protein
MGLGIRSHHVQESHTPVYSSSLDFHQVVSSLVPKVVGTMCRVCSAFEVFDDSDFFSDCTMLGALWSHGAWLDYSHM